MLRNLARRIARFSTYRRSLVLSLGTALTLFVLFTVACGSGDGDTETSPTPFAGDPTNTGATAIGEVDYEFQVTECGVSSTGAYNVLGSGTDPDGEPFRVRVAGDAASITINVSVGAVIAGQPGLKEFGVAIILSDPVNAPGSLQVNSDVFSLLASGTYVEISSPTLTPFPGTLELSCEAGLGV